MKKDIYALVDCNNFYASCERVFQPELENKPVGILSNNDGCIVALSNELKKLNIPRGTPAFKINHLIKKHGIKILSSNYALYGDMSARVMKTLSQFTPDLEIYSIDEAFLSLKGFEYLDLIEYGKKIRETVLQWTGIPTSIGIGPSKTLAKIAARVAKKYRKFNGVFNITKHPKMDDVLKSIDVGKVWGVGFKYAKMLKKNGINNAYELSQTPDKWVQKRMTIVGLKTVKELRGISCIDLEMDIDPKKEIVSSRSFGSPVTELSDLQEAAASYCVRAVEKLREQNQVASQIMVYLTTNRFRQNDPQYANYAISYLPLPSAYTSDFLHAVKRVLKSIFREGYKYKKVGVMISDIMHQSKAPLDFFEHTYLDDRRKTIMDCFDMINKKWGSNTLTYINTNADKKWKMKREKLSPGYTTNWNELPIVKA